MATQLAESFDTTDGTPEVIEGGEQGGAPADRNFEEEARQHGWVPKEEFKGDATRWTDAETFVKRADEVMPLLKKQNKALKAEIEAARRDMRKAADHFSKSEQRAYERALEEIKKEQEAAVEAGDLTAHRAASKKLDKLIEEKGPDDAPVASEEEVKEALFDFRASNRWYDTDAVARDYADELAQRHKAKTVDMSPSDFFTFIAGKVRERFPELVKGKEQPRPRSPVEGGSTGRPSRGGKSFNDLPVEAQRACDKWVKQGLIKDRDAYVKSYDWS